MEGDTEEAALGDIPAAQIDLDRAVRKLAARNQGEAFPWAFADSRASHCAVNERRDVASDERERVVVSEDGEIWSHSTALRERFGICRHARGG
jgi:hypothetical protein